MFLCSHITQTSCMDFMLGSQPPGPSVIMVLMSQFLGEGLSFQLCAGCRYTLLCIIKHFQNWYKIKCNWIFILMILNHCSDICVVLLTGVYSHMADISRHIKRGSFPLFFTRTRWYILYQDQVIYSLPGPGDLFFIIGPGDLIVFEDTLQLLNRHWMICFAIALK